MDISVRPCRDEDEQKRALEVCETAFGFGVRPEDMERFLKVLPRERTFAAFEGETMVGAGGNFPFELSVPGGTLPTAGLTMVGVLPSHRRKGALTKIMRATLSDASQCGEPLSVLWASEAVIYQRFGYGLASRHARLLADRDRVTFLEDASPVGLVRLITLEEAAKLLPQVYDRVMAQVPGMYARSDEWWRSHRLADPEHDRDGGGPMWCGLLEIDGVAEGYALYRIHNDWRDGASQGRLSVHEALATSPLATKELWRFLFGIDLIEKVEAWFQPLDHPLPLLITEPRRLRWMVQDALWERIVDIKGALEGRSYAEADSIVIDVADGFLPENAGRWRIDTTGTNASVERTEDAADLRLDTRDLAAVYLGGHTLAELLLALRGEELTEGAATRFDKMFRTNRAPCCPEIF
jgi:predicted acetyltransferase